MMDSTTVVTLVMMTVTVLPAVLCLRHSLSLVPDGGGDEGADAMWAGQHAVVDLLELTSRPRCSHVILTDETTSALTLNQVARVRGGGVSVVVAATHGVTHANHTNTLTQALLHARQLRMASRCLTMVVVSDQPIFLTTFATTADSSRLLVWSTRLIVVSQLPQPQLHNLMAAYWVFSMMNTLFLAPGNDRWEVYTHLPYTNGGAQVVMVAKWSASRGLVLIQGHTLFPEKYNTFHGSKVNMTVFPFAPYWMVGEGGKGGEFYITGRDYTILETIATALNFSINVLPYGEWEEVMGRLEDRTALISPIKLAIMPHLLEIYDFTFIIERATLGFTMAKPTLKPQWQSLYYPLRTPVWASIFATLLLVPAIHKAMSWTTSERTSTWRVTEVVLGSLLGQTIPGTLSHLSSTRLLVATWLVFSFIVGTAYRSNLTAFLTVPKYPPRPENFVQLMEAGSSIVMPPDMVDFYNNFRKSDSVVYQTLMDRVSFVKSFKEGLQMAMASNTAYLYERLNCQLLVNRHFTDMHGRTRLYVNSENVMPGYCAWPIARDLPFKAMLDRYIMACHGGGLITKWTTDVLQSAKSESTQQQEAQASSEVESEVSVEAEESGIKALTLVHMQGPLFLFLLGLFLSLTAFTFEFFLACFFSRNKGLSTRIGST